MSDYTRADDEQRDRIEAADRLQALNDTPWSDPQHDVLGDLQAVLRALGRAGNRINEAGNRIINDVG